MKRIKYGRLYWLQLEADDIDKFWWVRVFRKLGLTYIPWTLPRYNELYLREDRSRYSRRLIHRCRELGIVTYVVQEGPIYHPHQARWSHLPLYADLFLCPDADRELWIAEGMPRDRIKTYTLQKRRDDYTGVALLEPLTSWAECSHPSIHERNAAILKAVYELMEQDVLFAPDPRNAHLIQPFLPPHRIIQGSLEAMVKAYPEVYAFEESAAAGICRAVKKTFRRIGAGQLPPLVYSAPAAGPTKPGAVPGHKGVALLGSFVTWNDLGFTWRKDLHNVRVFRSLSEVADAGILLKPHHAHADLLLPFLPRERVTWEPVESLIARHKEVYCFWDSSVRKDCEMLGRPSRLIGVPENHPDSAR